MRRKDWADEAAERLHDVLVESEGDDQRVVDAVAVMLRQAFRTGLTHKQLGLMTQSSKSGDVTTYICTARRNPSRAEEAREDRLLRVSELETETAAGYKLTWNGEKSVKKGSGDNE